MTDLTAGMPDDEAGALTAAYERLATALHDSAGINLDHYKRSTVLRRVLRRMRRLGHVTVDDYADAVMVNAEEAQALARDVLLPQSQLFRDPEVFAGLTRLLPDLLASSPRPQIWVPACGSGEEVHSLAMLAADALSAREAPLDFRVFGTDFDQGALDMARQARFSLSAAERVPYGLRRRYLVPSGEEFVIAELLRNRCLFLRHDLLQPPPVSDVDFISFRNQLNTLELSAQRRVLENLRDALRPGGLLLVDGSEMPLAHPDLFQPHPLALGLHERVEPAAGTQPAASPQAAVAEQAPAYRSAFDFSSCAALLLDSQFRVIEANTAAAGLVQMPASSLPGRFLLDLVDAADRPRMRASLEASAASLSRGLLDANIPTADGKLPVRVRTLSLRSGGPAAFLVELQYESAASEARAELVYQANRMNMAMQVLSEGIVVTDPQGAITTMNTQAEKLTGWSSAEALSQPHERVLRLSGPGGAALQSPVWRCLRENQIIRIGGQDGNADHFLLARDGRRLSLRLCCAPFPGPNGATGTLIAFEDTTQQSLLAEELAFRASHDAVTGLLNRDELERRLTAAVTEARRGGIKHLFCYLDLDQFKVINDTLGHYAGDEMLRQLAVHLRSRLRPYDALARLGGDEFGVLMERTDFASGTALVDGLLDAARNLRFFWDGENYTSTVSIGVVEIDAMTVSAASALSSADAACYAAKDAGRDRAQQAGGSNEYLRQRKGDMDMVARINRALDQNEFVLHYEDVVRIAAPHEVVYRELLVRMREPGTGALIYPGHFIPAAERFFLMGAVDRWIINAALAGISRRPNDGVIYAMNISGLSLSDEKFLKFVETRFDTLGVAPEQVCFEITETAAISRLTEAVRFMERLAEQGCRFSLDDFGAGMASFSYLKNLPVNFLKIDGSFVRSMKDSQVDRGMVEAANRIGHDMGLKTIAEHVEDAQVLEALRVMGVDFAQGRAIAPGRPFAELLPEPRG